MDIKHLLKLLNQNLKVEIMDYVKIAFLGDIMPGGLLTGRNIEFLSNEAKDYLFSHDLRVGTLECPIGDIYHFDKNKIESGIYDIVFAKNEDIERLTNLNIDVVSLANNHIFDLDITGFKNTISLLKAKNIKFCGAGMNKKEASEPLIVEVKNKKIAFLAYCKHLGWSSKIRIASDNFPGINPLIESDVIRDIKKLKNENCIVFLLLHWGNEHTFYPLNKDRKLAFSLIKAGADGIIGSHSHRVQPKITYRGKPVYFSLGNFLFPDRYISPPRVTYYPDSFKNVNDYPISFDYKKVTEPTLKLWRRHSRIGIIGVVEISEKIISKVVFSELTANNKLILAKKDLIQIRIMLNYISTFIKTPLYPAIIFIKRSLNYLKRLIKKL